MELKHCLWIVLVCLHFSPNHSINCAKERKCRTIRTHGLKASDCYRQDLKEMPKCLPSDVQVIDLSYNRIRRLTRQDLERYPSVSFLYLMDNIIFNLDEETFKDMTNLETLDLSVNILQKVPATVFQLPSLKNLYLSQNMNMNIAESVERAKPISESSLTNLDISYITYDGITADFPDFGEFPLLAALNVTGNQFGTLTTKHFAGLCNLQNFASDNVTAEFEYDCDCWKINRWLTVRKVNFTQLPCPVNEQVCLNEQISEDDLEIYEKCKMKFETIQRFFLLRKLGLWIGIPVAVILLLIGIYCYIKWSKSRQKYKRGKYISSNS